MEGSEGPQRPLSRTNRCDSRISGTRNRSCLETQRHRVCQKQWVREAQDVERLDKRTHARDQREARLQTRSRLDNLREEPGVDRNEIKPPRSNPQRLTSPDRIQTRKEGSPRNRA